MSELSGKKPNVMPCVAIGDYAEAMKPLGSITLFSQVAALILGKDFRRHK